MYWPLETTGWSLSQIIPASRLFAGNSVKLGGREIDGFGVWLLTLVGFFGCCLSSLDLSQRLLVCTHFFVGRSLSQGLYRSRSSSSAAGPARAQLRDRAAHARIHPTSPRAGLGR